MTTYLTQVLTILKLGLLPYAQRGNISRPSMTPAST